MRTVVAEPTPFAHEAPPVAETPARPVRWGSLDVLRGVALWAMVAHHFALWTGGRVNQRFIGFEHFLVTDLAAPVFAVGAGAAALIVGSRIHTRPVLLARLRRWGEVLAVGVGIDLAVDGSLDGGGVLPTLAVLGCAVMLLVAAGLRKPWQWWTVTLACVFLVAPAETVAGDDLWVRFLNGAFSLPVYGVFAAAGAAVAAHALGRSESSIPLWRASAGVLVVGLLLYATAGGAVAPDGLWPPARHPGYLPFTVWGLIATFALWAGLRRLAPVHGVLGRAAAQAGQRTLLIFAGHYTVKLILKVLGVFHQLDTFRWGLVTWLAVALVCIVTTIPRDTFGRFLRLKQRQPA